MDFYHFAPSIPCRAVLLTAKALGLELNKIEVNILEGDQMKEEFVALNPQHIIPTLVDDDLTLWESSAICQYLVNQYAEDDTLYPKDSKVRAKLDRLLYFNMATLMARVGKYAFPIMMGSGPKDDAALEKIQEALGYLDGDLCQCDYAVGDAVTVADIALVSTVSTLQEMGVDLSGHENVTAWLERCQENMEGYEEENAVGARTFGEMFKAKLEE